ncbi:AMP-binding protein [Mammaliicoccus sp. Dog046]|uniref:AMP-binding protein n=1 Tax=Mammaliicoccus sp. Dog046 TaxID=3034233 RepID=UPI002B262DC3|nr:AMP-binding protein [Mammaliicoccus sp. Dog046]WQK84774.1 AMP-binding protein [Mammaliicoccus sp. Dog046]
MTILDLIKQQVEQNKAEIAVYADGQEITYQELWQKSHECSEQLSCHDEGTKIGIAIKHPIQFIKWYIGALINHQIPCVIDASREDNHIRDVLTINHIPIYIDKTEQIIVMEKVEVQSLPHDTLHIGFTSGTTGMPKAYVRSHMSWMKSFQYNDAFMNENIKVYAAPGPHSHSLSLYVMIYALCRGKCFYGQYSFNAQKLVQELNRLEQNKTLFVVPTMIYSILNEGVNLKNLSSMYSSGAKLPRAIFEKLKTKYPLIDIIEFFGSSEASFISYNLNGKAPIDTVGYLFPSVKIKLENKGTDQIGKLFVSSDMIFSGYLNSDNDHSWIEVGDWASINEQQELRLYGRDSERLIIGGKNIYPEVIEQSVLSIDDVFEAIVIGEDHHQFGEIAVLIYRGDVEIKYKDLRKLLLSKGLSRYEIPSKLTRVRKMNYTESGKISRYKMKCAYQNGGKEWKQLL